MTQSDISKGSWSWCFVLDGILVKPVQIAGTCQLTERCLVYTKNPLSFEPSGIGQNLIGLAIHGLTGFSLLVLVDCGVFHDIVHKLACIGRLYTNRDIISLNKVVVEEKVCILLYHNIIISDIC